MLTYSRAKLQYVFFTYTSYFVKLPLFYEESISFFIKTMLIYIFHNNSEGRTYMDVVHKLTLYKKILIVYHQSSIDVTYVRKWVLIIGCIMSSITRYLFQSRVLKFTFQ